jgi:hypothetical protein
MKNLTEDEVIKKLAKHYNISEERAKKNLNDYNKKQAEYRLRPNKSANEIHKEYRESNPLPKKKAKKKIKVKKIRFKGNKKKELKLDNLEIICFNCSNKNEPEMYYSTNDGEGTYRYECSECNNIILIRNKEDN